MQNLTSKFKIAMIQWEIIIRDIESCINITMYESLNNNPKLKTFLNVVKKEYIWFSFSLSNLRYY